MSVTCDICGQEFKDSRGLAGHRQFKHAGEREERGETKALAKTGSLDAAVDKLQVPAVPEEFNGAAQIYWAGFNKGVSYGVNTIMAGIRSAQELSSLGIAQATPIIKMAQEMRQAEGQAAQELAAQLGQVTMQSNQQILQSIQSLAAAQSQGQPSEMNPLAKMFVDAMQPHAAQAIGQLFASLSKKPGQGGVQPQGGQQPGQPAQPAGPGEPARHMPPGEEDQWTEI